MATTEQPSAGTSRISFTLLFTIALVIGLGAAVVIAPFALLAVNALGFRFPFPRIFDRTVMITLFAVLFIFARPLRLIELLRRGFDRPSQNLLRVASGLGLAILALLIMFVAGTSLRDNHFFPAGPLAARAIKYVAAAFAIGVLEEGFFRAFLLGGIARDYGRGAALIGSSAFYSVVHLLHAPSHYYLTGFHPAAGAKDLVASAAHLSHPIAAMPTLLGLFLLGIVLGEAFLLTGNVYFSIGMHAGFVLGAKSWPVIARAARPVPHWLAGAGPVPLIAAPAAWTVAVILMLLLPAVLPRTPLRPES